MNCFGVILVLFVCFYTKRLQWMICELVSQATENFSEKDSRKRNLFVCVCVVGGEDNA